MGTGGAKSASACITSLRIVGENKDLAVSTQTAKPPNLIPRQLFRLYSMSHCYISVAVVMVGFASENVLVREDNGTVWLVLVKSGENAVSIAVEFTTTDGSATGQQP